MGFMDKAKDAAAKAAASAQQAAAQGQAKVQEYQATKASEDALFRTLGRAFYEEQRHGGSRDAVVSALNAVDAARAGVGQPGATPADTPPATGYTTPAAPAGGFTPPPPTFNAPPAGGFAPPPPPGPPV
jgi:hypothetical protein